MKILWIILLLTTAPIVHARQFSLNNVSCNLFNQGNQRKIHNITFKVVCVNNEATKYDVEFEFERTWSEYFAGISSQYKTTFDIKGSHASRIAEFIGESKHVLSLYCAKGSWANTGATFKKKNLDGLVGYIDSIEPNFDDCKKNTNKLVEDEKVGVAINSSKKEGEQYFDRSVVEPTKVLFK